MRRNSFQLLICLSLDPFFLLLCSAEAVDRAERDDFDVAVLCVDDGVGVDAVDNGYHNENSLLIYYFNLGSFELINFDLTFK